MDILHDYLDAYGYGDDDEKSYIRKSVGEASCDEASSVQVHLPDGFTYPMKYVMNIWREPRFNECNLKKYLWDRNLAYNIDNFSSCNTFVIKLNCICRLNEIFSDHHRTGFIDTFTFVNTGVKKMIIQAPRYVMHVLEKCRSSINVDKMTCDEIQKYILWQEDILIENKCVLFDICDDRLILSTVLSF